MSKYLYQLLFKYFSVFISSKNKILEIKPSNNHIFKSFSNSAVLFPSEQSMESVKKNIHLLMGFEDIKTYCPDYILLNGTIHYENDIQKLLCSIRNCCEPKTRLVITYYSSLWRPLMKLADFLGMRKKMPEDNWISHDDVKNFLLLSDFEIVRRDSQVLIPIWIPFISWFTNKYLSKIPFFNLFNLVNIAVAKPTCFREEIFKHKPSVSIVIAARNEEGHIEDIVRRIPQLGPQDEIIFIEGHSNDNTWGKIKETKEKYKNEKNIIIGQQDGKGKGDAVRKGFNLATKEILMILDADMTVPPEDLIKFYNAIIHGKGEFINGSRLVYPMEKKAMQFCNLIANKFFAIAFTFVLGQNFKDTLCGTKVITRENYNELAKNRAYFGDFDPFGDFDLIFGAVRLNLKVIEIPIGYKERIYGSTNISRWKHGLLLFAMLVFAAKKLKFI